MRRFPCCSSSFFDFSTATSEHQACVAMLFSLDVEISQLYHAPWIDSIRRTTLSGLLLGFGFIWSDLACYAVGVAIGGSHSGEGRR